MTNKIIEWIQQPEPLPAYPASLTTAYHILHKKIYRNPWLDKPYRLLTRRRSILRQLYTIYNLTDQLTAYITPAMVCQKGCAHCCHKDLTLSMLEAQYIADSLQCKPETKTTRTSGYTTACPFLDKDNTCKIYEVRPFKCRTLFAQYSPVLCEHDMQQHLYQHFHDSVLTGLFDMVLHLDGRQPLRDIRDFFPKYD